MNTFNQVWLRASLHPVSLPFLSVFCWFHLCVSIALVWLLSWSWDGWREYWNVWCETAEFHIYSVCIHSVVKGLLLLLCCAKCLQSVTYHMHKKVINMLSSAVGLPHWQWTTKALERFSTHFSQEEYFPDGVWINSSPFVWSCLDSVLFPMIILKYCCWL